MKIEVENNDKNAIVIYTDGANRNTGNVAGEGVKETDKAAYGYYMTYKGADKLKSFGVYGKTNNYCEIMGVYSALKTLKTNTKPVKLYSDSAYVVNCLNNKWYETWRRNNWTKKGGLKNAEEWKKLIEVYEKFPFIEIIKVKGHQGVGNYNDLIDKELNECMDNMEGKSGN